MPNDAKLGLVIGVMIVIALGVIYHRNEAPAILVRTRPEPAAVNAVSPGTPYGTRRLTGMAESDEGPGMPESAGDEPAR